MGTPPPLRADDVGAVVGDVGSYSCKDGLRVRALSQGLLHTADWQNGRLGGHATLRNRAGRRRRQRRQPRKSGGRQEESCTFPP
ncbi:unnamed protein product, partial [Ectocarpus sp. 6 AP-2014]